MRRMTPRTGCALRVDDPIKASISAHPKLAAEVHMAVRWTAIPMSALAFMRSRAWPGVAWVSSEGLWGGRVAAAPVPLRARPPLVAKRT